MDLLLLTLFLFCLFLFARWFLGVGVGPPFLPVRRRDIRAGFSLVNVGADDVVIDLGSGDGRVLVEAASRGAWVIGYEINPFFVWWSRRKLRPFAERSAVHCRNLFDADLSETTVIFVFGFANIMEALGKKIRKEAKPGTRVVSFGFAFPGWEVQATEEIASLYVV